MKQKKWGGEIGMGESVNEQRGRIGRWREKDKIGKTNIKRKDREVKRKGQDRKNKYKIEG